MGNNVNNNCNFVVFAFSIFSYEVGDDGILPVIAQFKGVLQISTYENLVI